MNSRNRLAFVPPELVAMLENIERETQQERAAAARRQDPRCAAAMLSALFSTTQLRLFAALFGQPDRSYHLKELVRVAACGVGVAHRELARLESVGLLSAEWDRGRKRYRVDARAPIQGELCALVRKSIGLASPLREALAPIEAEIGAAFVCNGFPRCDPGLPALQLVVLAPHWPPGLDDALIDASRKLARRVEAIVLPSGSAGWLIETLMAQPRVWVIGSDKAPMTSGP